MATTPLYGAFESNPARFTDAEAWVYQHDNVWRQMSPSEVRHHAAVLTEAQFRAEYPSVPPLPAQAFRSTAG